VRKYITDTQDKGSLTILFVIDHTASFGDEGYAQDRVRMGLHTREIIDKNSLWQRRLFLAKMINVFGVYICGRPSYIPFHLPYENDFLFKWKITLSASNAKIVF